VRRISGHIVCVCFCSLFIILTGCVNFLRRDDWVTEKYYSKTDTLVTNLVVLCNAKTFRKLFVFQKPDYQQLSINNDSVFNKFAHGMKQLEIPFVIQNVHFICDSSNLHNDRLKFKRMNISAWIDSIPVQPGVTYLIPVIYLEKFDNTHVMLSSSLVASGDRRRHLYTRIMIIILKGRKVKYLRAVGTSSGTDYIDELNPDPIHNLNQNTWDYMINKLMKHYLKRMR
jgi:hypothetical protein